MSRGHEFRTVIEGDDEKNVINLTEEQRRRMGKIVFGIFAHPDDEAFCVAATLLKEVSDGSQVHLICITDGSGKHSMNPDNVANLSETRMNEWREAGKMIGATKQYNLGYSDGTLNNDNHIEIARKIEDIVKDALQDNDDNQVEFITLDTNGITGHIDHIVAARSALLAFYRLKKDGFPVTRTRLACISDEDFSDVNTAFTFREQGRLVTEIDETVDVRDSMYDQVREVMLAHHSQREDANYWIETLGDKIAVNHFIVKD